MDKDICWREVSGDKNCKCSNCNHSKSCENKVRYESEIKARQERGWKEEEYGQKFIVYECPLCEGWHLASISDRFN